MNELDDLHPEWGDDASSSWLGQVFEHMRSAGTADELSAEHAVVSAMARTIAQPPVVVDLGTRRRLAVSKTAARIAIAAAVTLVGASTAAATGNLPDAAQSAVARATSHLGVDIPDPHHDTATRSDADEHETPPSTSSSSTSSTSSTSTSLLVVGIAPDQSAMATAVEQIGDTTPSSPSTAHDADESTQRPIGPDADGPAKSGLCRAWVAHRDDSPANERSTAMQALQDAAAAAGQTVDQFCAEVAPVETTPTETTATQTSEPAPEPDAHGNKNKNANDGDNKDNQKKDKEPGGTD